MTSTNLIPGHFGISVTLSDQSDQVTVVTRGNRGGQMLSTANPPLCFLRLPRFALLPNVKTGFLTNTNRRDRHRPSGDFEQAVLVTDEAFLSLSRGQVDAEQVLKSATVRPPRDPSTYECERRRDTDKTAKSKLIYRGGYEIPPRMIQKSRSHSYAIEIVHPAHCHWNAVEWFSCIVALRHALRLDRYVWEGLEVNQ